MTRAVSSCRLGGCTAARGREARRYHCSGKRRDVLVAGEVARAGFLESDSDLGHLPLVRIDEGPNRLRREKRLASLSRFRQ